MRTRTRAKTGALADQVIRIFGSTAEAMKPAQILERVVDYLPDLSQRDRRRRFSVALLRMTKPSGRNKKDPVLRRVDTGHYRLFSDLRKAQQEQSPENDQKPTGFYHWIPRPVASKVFLLEFTGAAPVIRAVEVLSVFDDGNSMVIRLSK